MYYLLSIKFSSFSHQSHKNHLLYKMIGIDSCPIEGFDDTSKIAEVLSVDTGAFDVAVLVALGTRAMDITPKKRLDFDVVVEYV